MVDTISSLASVDYRHDEGRRRHRRRLAERPDAATRISFNCISAKALAASKTARLPRSYWGWRK
jgi:alanine-glyoxylate transaminase/serine-glyoxylate transaminase/serine-pyruvate transaminase